MSYRVYTRRLYILHIILFHNFKFLSLTSAKFYEQEGRRG